MPKVKKPKGSRDLNYQPCKTPYAERQWRAQMEHSGFRKAFLSDPGIPGVRSMGPSVSNSLTESLFADLTDVSLVDEDTNSILADDTNRAEGSDRINKCYQN